ncbi:MAG: acyl-CoA dehydrogenase family protein, partial [Actinomycetota bacterium]
MSWQLSEQQKQIQAKARALATEVIGPRAAAVDQAEQYPWDNVHALRDAGFTGMTVPTELGGPGHSFLDAVLVVEEMAKVCGVTGRIAVEANMGAISAVLAYGTEQQRKLAADLVLSGDKPAICITEPEAGSSASEMTTRADRRGDTYIINGTKHWITGGTVSKLHL